MATVIFATNFHQEIGSRCLVRESGGDLYVGLQTVLVAPDTTAHIRVWHGGADGSAWTQKDSGNAPRCLHQVAFGCAIDSSGVIHFVYRDETNADEYNYISFDTATDTFGSESANVFTSPEDTASLSYASVAIDSNDKVHAVVRGMDKTGPNFWASIYYINNVSGSWSAGVEIDGDKNTANCEIPSIAINNSNIPVVVYDDETNVDLKAALGNQNDATSFTLVIVDNTFNPIAPLYWDAPSIAVDHNGNVWVGYAGFLANAKVAKQSSDWTSAWSKFDSGEGATFMVSVVPHAGDIHIFYDSSDEIIHNKFDPGGVVWEGETVLFSTDHNQVASARWSKHNNPSYIIYGMDIVFLHDLTGAPETDNSDLYYANYEITSAGQVIFF